MRRMKFLQAFIIMMFALVFAGKGKVFAANGDIEVYVETKDGQHLMADSGDKTFNGLIWDGGKNELTLNNYNGESICMLSKNGGVKKCTIKVNGINTIKANKYSDLFRVVDIDATFIGDGTINMIMFDEKEESAIAQFGQDGLGSITIDGPNIYLKNNIYAFVAYNFIMKSGSLNIEQCPSIYQNSGETRFDYGISLFVPDMLVAEGGSINIEYVYPKGYNNVSINFYDDFAICMESPEKCYLGGETINLKVADELKNLVKFANKERSVSFVFEGDENEYTNLDAIKGLSWDEKNFVLTMDGYDGTAMYIKSNFVIEDIDVVVKGTNNIKAVKGNNLPIYADNVNFNFIGTGSVKIDASESTEKIALYMKAKCEYGGKLEINGPTIDISANGTHAVSVNSFVMNSGYLNIELYKDSEKQLTAIYVNYGVEINGGIIVVKYNGNAVDAYPVIVARKNIDDESYLPGSIDNCIIVLIANEQILNIIEPCGCYLDGLIDYSEPAIKVGKNVTIEKATSLDKVKIDISKFKASLSETKFVYDGKEKKPIVSIKNLVENKDFTVKYVNNINPGKASAVVTGKGMFTGEIKLDFTIEEAVGEYGPAEGSKVRDKKYIYKVIKAGTKDGKIVGQVRVVGLKKKSLKKIKIANVVTIDNVKYKVTQIGAKAFKGNKKIKSVVIGKNVTTIGKQAFYNCKTLKTVKINSKKLKRVGKKAFYRKGGKKLTIKVPKKSKKKYKKILKKAKTNKYVVK